MSNHDAAPSDRMPDAARARHIVPPPKAPLPKAPAAKAEDEHSAKERYAVGILLRNASDGVARKTHTLELLADHTRGASQATVYKALQALEKERAIFSDLEGRLETVGEGGDWEDFKLEALRALDTVRDPDDDPDVRPPPRATPPRPRPAATGAAAKH